MSARTRPVSKVRVQMPPPIISATCITIALPIPHRSISPNGRTGNSKAAAICRSKTVKAHKLAAQLILKNILQHTGPIKVTGYALAHYFSTAAFRDDDNADGACKAYRDGIARALGIDDRDLRKCALSTLQKDPSCPRVEITLHLASLS